MDGQPFTPATFFFGQFCRISKNAPCVLHAVSLHWPDGADVPVMNNVVHLKRFQTCFLYSYLSIAQVLKHRRFARCVIYYVALLFKPNNLANYINTTVVIV